MKEAEIIDILSHSYFKHNLKEIAPFIEYFDERLKLSLNNIDSETLEKIFLMASLLTLDISLPFKYNFDRKFRKYQWLTELRPFGSKSKQGVVVQATIFDSVNVVLKKAKSSDFDEITLRDFCVGTLLNKIINNAPFFVRTLGCFNFKNKFYISTEFIDGINLKAFLQSKTSTFNQFLNIFFQILLGLEMAQDKLKFTHYDLHTDNVILVQTNETICVSLHGNEYIIKNWYKPVMIDFGLSSACVKGKTLGQKRLEHKCIFPHISPGYDMYIFLLFCIDVVQKTNNEIYKGITDLLLFFKDETGLSLKLLTENHIKSLKQGVSQTIPHQFIKYIVKNYKDDLNVEIRPKKYNSDCLLKQPLFLKFKKMLDNNDELQVIYSKNSKKGLVRALINNIQIYYWYKDKISIKPDEYKQLLLLDEINLKNIIHDLNLKIGSNITIEQKNLFFIAMEYYNLILELELNLEHDSDHFFYNEYINEFKSTYVFKNISNQLDSILLADRLRCI